ncbi:MAG: sugar phosphate isomerase/epimerase family protein [Bryobacterales bacterium]|nr:sugar phosphate isomerase/epimerase [Bryobacteraceae bacterium]MDW8355320.1 sugar phosphate isomerase/epimerase family protein [Bryobacterales bacterium]
MPATKAARRSPYRKSINLWAFPYPAKWSLEECFRLAADAGFDAIELNFDLTGEFSAETSDADLRRIGDLARRCRLEISGVCSFLWFPYSLTSNDAVQRNRGLELARRMIEAAARVGTSNLLVVAGSCYIPWIEGAQPVPSHVCWRRAREAIHKLLPAAERAKVSLNVENIFANGFLLSAEELVRFVDGFRSRWVGVHFDTGNIMQFQFPEHWIPVLGRRIRNVHFKEWDKRTREFHLNTFRTLLDGTTNWPAVMQALENVGYRGYVTFEYFHPFEYYPEALIYQASDALDWILGRKH